MLSRAYGFKSRPGYKKKNEKALLSNDTGLFDFNGGRYRGRFYEIIKKNGCKTEKIRYIKELISEMDNMMYPTMYSLKSFIKKAKIRIEVIDGKESPFLNLIQNNNQVGKIIDPSRWPKEITSNLESLLFKIETEEEIIDKNKSDYVNKNRIIELSSIKSIDYDLKN